jgi:hypothetical protein
MYQLVEAPNGGTERGIRDMNEPDIRWKQRFSNFNKALLQLGNAVELSQQRPLSDLERQGLIKAKEVASNVTNLYYPLFLAFQRRMQELQDAN